MWSLVEFLRLPNAKRQILVEAAICLSIARIAIMALPFPWIVPFLGQNMTVSLDTTEPEHSDLIKQVSWAVRTASRRLPGKASCLARAIAAKRMLRRRGVQSTLYLGIGKDGDGKLRAHAWLRSGNVIASGARGMVSFTVISTFANGRR